jgi:hypothetical protein
MSLPLNLEKFSQQVWSDTHGTEFLVDDVYGHEGKTWVEYHRVNDNTYYNCLLEAFTDRFNPRDPKQ